MLKKPLFWEMSVLLLIVGILNYIAYSYDLYFKLHEFDSVVHFFGGAALSAFFIWLYFYSGFFEPKSRKLCDFLMVSLFGAMFIGLTWEIYEFFLGEVVIRGVEYPYDTMMDLIMDFLGATTVCFYGYLKTSPPTPLLEAGEGREKNNNL